MLEFRTISRVARVLMNLNQRQLGERLGLSLEAVSAWERGVTTPTEWHRKAFEALCVKHGLGFMSNGMPVLVDNQTRMMTATQEVA